MRILVCGSRDYSKWVRFQASIFKVAPVNFDSVEIIHGGCMTGADAMAARFCRERGVNESVHPAQWHQHGHAAGPIRNSAMADLGADICLAFWDGNSRGTLDMIQKAVRKGTPVRIVP